MVLSAEEKRERKRIANKKYREKNREKIALKQKEYYENNKEKVLLSNKEYSQTPNGKKVNTLKKWKSRGLSASKEELDRIYNLYLNQELCNACDCVLTRTGVHSKTNITMDHDHSNGRFRHVICNSCNAHDNWKKHFC
tara:strand:+ start:850 stop:1263 length:414 start_codon:yes stop_codon:yes gene_type:complete